MASEDAAGVDQLLQMRQAIAKGYEDPRQIKVISFDKDKQEFIIKNPAQRGVWKPYVIKEGRREQAKNQIASVRLAAAQAPAFKKPVSLAVKKQKKPVNQKLMTKPCPEGKMRNPATGRCVNIVKPKRTKKSSPKPKHFASILKKIKALELSQDF
ncbi:MAG: hypothetical protein EHM20_13480 [Alphaproteobacteria bacterium]|nr:MAG: hypothetical protein EHM20_13480 [Alphaproteobacteria bacterium]